MQPNFCRRSVNTILICVLKLNNKNIIREDFDMEDEIDLEGKICLFFELITPLW